MKRNTISLFFFLRNHEIFVLFCFLFLSSAYLRRQNEPRERKRLILKRKRRKNLPSVSKILLFRVFTVPQLLFTGFYVSTSQIPVLFRWIQWIMPLTYAFRLALNNELYFCKDQASDDCSIATVSLGSDLLEEQQATDDLLAAY